MECWGASVNCRYPRQCASLPIPFPCSPAPLRSYVSLVPPYPENGAGRLTLVLESLLGACIHCAGRLPGDVPVTQNVTVSLVAGTGLPGPGARMYAWLTTQAAPFVQQPDIFVGPDGAFTVSLPQDALLTLSTEVGAAHGAAPSPPGPVAPFPLPWVDNFDGYAYDTQVQEAVGGEPLGWLAPLRRQPLDDPPSFLLQARYFSDQGGSFGEARGGRRKGQLAVVALVTVG